MAIATDLHQIQLPMCVAHALWTLHGHHFYYVCMRLSQQISIRCSYSILPMYVAHALWTLHGHHHLYYVCMKAIATDLHQMQLFHPSSVCCACIMDTPWSPSLLRLHEAIATDPHQMQLFHPSYVCCACIMDTPWSPPSLLRLHEGYRNRSPSDTGIPSFLCMLRMHYGHSMVTTISTTFA